MSVQSIPEPVVARKPSPAAQVGRRWIVYIQIPALPFRDFSWWPGVVSVSDSPQSSVIGVDFSHPDAVGTLLALKHLAPESVRRVELGA